MSRVAMGSGIVAGVVAIAAFLLGFTATPAVVDLPLATISFGLLGAALIVLTLLVRRSRTPVASAILIATLVVVGVSAHQRFFVVQERGVSFRNGEVELSGALVLPRGSGPFPGLVIVHGSGPQTRREYAYYARRLARGGVAALAYDKRGSGKSDGALYQSDFADYAEDAAAALEALRAESAVDPTRVGLLGYSEGEWTAPLAATRAGGVAFVAVVGASGRSPSEQVNAEIALRLRSLGHSERDIERALELNERVFAYQRDGRGAESLRADLAATADAPWFRDAEDIPSELYPLEEYAWWRSVMDFDPRPVWAQISAPVLLLKGADDDRSPSTEACSQIAAALRDGGQSPPRCVIFEDADHNLLTWPLGRGRPPPLFARSYFAEIVAFAAAAPDAGR